MTDAATYESETRAGEEGFATRRLAKTYAEALLNVADKRGVVEAIGEELAGLVEIFRLHPDFEHLLASRAIQRSTKQPLLARAFEGKVSDLFYDFLRLLNQKDRLDLIHAISTAYRDLCDERAKRVRVIVRTAVPLDDAQQEALRATLRASLQREPILDMRVDVDLLGGMIVQVGDEVFDSSVRTRIEAIRNQLLARSSHEIQVGRDRFSSNA